MTISAIIFKSLLSLDSYNRGCNASIDLDNNHNDSNYSADTEGLQIGGATIIENRGQVDAVAIGFYGIAYSYNGETIIAYRGTLRGGFNQRAEGRGSHIGERPQGRDRGPCGPGLER